jgi:hypothetical protein
VGHLAAAGIFYSMLKSFASFCACTSFSVPNFTKAALYATAHANLQAKAEIKQLQALLDRAKEETKSALCDAEEAKTVVQERDMALLNAATDKVGHGLSHKGEDQAARRHVCTNMTCAWDVVAVPNATEC